MILPNCLSIGVSGMIKTASTDLHRFPLNQVSSDDHHRRFVGDLLLNFTEVHRWVFWC